MSMISIQPSTSQATSVPARPDPKDPLAGMTRLTPEGQEPRAKQSIEITKNALKRIRVAMAKGKHFAFARWSSRWHHGRRLFGALV